MGRRNTHLIDHADIALAQMEFRLILGKDWEYLPIILESIYCDCNGDENELVDYQPYLNDLNDLILRGSCKSCGQIASRYIETGEIPEKVEIAEQIRRLYRQNK